jgi:hypothetical protein
LYLQDATVKSCCGNDRGKSEGKNSGFPVSNVEPSTCRTQAGPISVSYLLGLFSYCFPNSFLSSSFHFVFFLLFFYFTLFLFSFITNSLHRGEPFLRSRQLCSYSRISQHFMKPRVHYRVHKSPPLVPIRFPIRITLPAHFILLDLILLIMLSEEGNL